MGAQVFAKAGCGGCHSLAAAKAHGNVGPDLDEVHPDFARVSEQVREGGDGMPPFADRLTEREIESVAAYVSEVAGGR
jgi:mono/diheme cytochrome c family protein